MTPNTQLRALLDHAERRLEVAEAAAQRPVPNVAPVRVRDLQTGRSRSLRARPIVPEERASERKARVAAIHGLARHTEEARSEILADFDRLAGILEQVRTPS